MRRENPIQIKSKAPYDLGHDTEITFLKKIKKQPNLTMVKMPKSTTLIIRPRYSYEKQIKTCYEAQFLTDPMLSNEIEKTFY
jgi:hypothetical protein